MRRAQEGEETHPSGTPAEDGAHRLRVLGPGIDARHALQEKRPTLVGRYDGADVVVPHASVSRDHLEVMLIGGRMMVTDLGSRNGTWVAGVRLVPDRSVAVDSGMSVRAGDVLLVLDAPAAFAHDAPSVGGSTSSAMAPMLELADRVAPDDVPVLLLGETGVGKEVLAERIHGRSLRAAGPLLKLHCAALSPSLVESELFGYERGAFTGADRSRVGLLLSASGGTVFIDEVGELGADLQVKLLRVLDERRVLPVGARTSVSVDVRFIAATHRDLRRAVRAGTFREDLYFRLSGVTISIPPLRERKDELEALALELLSRACAERNRTPPAVSSEARAKLVAHSWPGNVRELRNVIVRSLLMSDGGTIRGSHVVLDEVPASSRRGSAPRAGSVPSPGKRERDRIIEALERCGGNQTEAAKILGMARRTLLYKLDVLRVPRPRKQPPGD